MNTEIENKIKQIQIDNIKAIKEGEKILKLLPEESYSWFYIDSRRHHDPNYFPEERLRLVTMDCGTIYEAIKNVDQSIARYIVTKEGSLFIEIENENGVAYLPSVCHIRTAGAAWSEKAWFNCLKGQQEFIGMCLYLNNKFTELNDLGRFNQVFFDLSRINVLYAPYILHPIYPNSADFDFLPRKNYSDFYNIGHIDLEDVQREYHEIISWIDDDKDKDNFVKLYNKNNGKLFLTVFNLVDMIECIKYRFDSKYTEKPLSSSNFIFLQDYYKYDLKCITIKPEEEHLFSQEFHNLEEAFELFNKIYKKYIDRMRPIMRLLPSKKVSRYL